MVAEVQTAGGVVLWPDTPGLPPSEADTPCDCALRASLARTLLHNALDLDTTDIVLTAGVNAFPSRGYLINPLQSGHSVCSLHCTAFPGCLLYNIVQPSTASLVAQQLY